MANVKIALEEAFGAPGMERYLPPWLAEAPPAEIAKIDANLADFDRRIEVMDAAAIDVMVLSETSPGVQAERDVAAAVERARASNEFLKAQIDRHPQRYRGFAHLAMQDVSAACAELERCVTGLGFLGALVNGQTQGVYLDDPRYLPFWDRVAELGVPFYLHPADPYRQPHVLEGHTELQAAVWGWNLETSSHFLRLVFSGLFDRYPDLTIILGHMGETLPFYLWRLDSRYAFYAESAKVRLRMKPSEYLRRNLAVTTTGVCSDDSLRCAIGALGVDRVMFSVDYPYEDAQGAADWIDAAALTDAERNLVCRQNAARILRL